MKINLEIIIDIYKKASIFIGALSLLSFVVVSFVFNYFKGYSFAVGNFIIFLNVVGIMFIAKFCRSTDNVEKDKLVFSILLFMGKLFFLLVLIFLIIHFKLVDNIMFLGGLSLGFFIFFIANLIFLPLKIYKLEKRENFN
jgi:F0F1-type ATP synthase assembly protein I